MLTSMSSLPPMVVLTVAMRLSRSARTKTSTVTFSPFSSHAPPAVSSEDQHNVWSTGEEFRARSEDRLG
jgi:hypothetical protein